jgi:predicted Zn-dependent protease
VLLSYGLRREVDSKGERMLKDRATRWLLAAAAALAIGAVTPQTTWAVGDEPSFPPPQEKEKKQTKEKKKRKQKQKQEKETKQQKEPKESSLNQDQIYSLGYWQAKTGEYGTALATLQSAPDQGDPRVQTMIGFSLRKLGRVDEAFGYYRKALATRPDATTTRQYLGEAYLQIGDVARAREQLAEIARRCGTACEDYTALAEEIAKRS